MDLIDLESVNKVFDSPTPVKSDADSTISVPDIVSHLVSLYEPLAIHAPSSRSVNIPLSVDLVLNWLLNVYDRSLSHRIVLCVGFISEPFSFFPVKVFLGFIILKNDNFMLFFK